MLVFRDARAADVASVVRLYADDALAATREVVGDPPGEQYLRAGAQLDADPRQRRLA